MKNRIKAVDMTRRIRDTHYEQLKDKTHQERIAFYRKKSRSVQARASSLLHKQES